MDKLKTKFIDLNFDAFKSLNMNLVDKSRVITNIFSGMASGILGLSAFQGIMFWIMMCLATSVVISITVITLSAGKGSKGIFFKNVSDAATHNMFSNVMTFLLFWIMFYNVVYVV